MKKLLAYLNSLPPDRQIAYCSLCNTTLGYLRKACSVQQKIGAEICVAIERESEGVVSRRDLRPDDWWLIWPELVTDDFPAPSDKKAA